METTATLMANVKGIFSSQIKTSRAYNEKRKNFLPKHEKNWFLQTPADISNQIANGQFINFFDKFIVLVH